MAADHVDVSLDPLQPVVEEVGTGQSGHEIRAPYFLVRKSGAETAHGSRSGAFPRSPGSLEPGRQRLDALFRQDREAGLDPVVGRQLAVHRGPGPRHEQQVMAPDTPKTNADVTSDMPQEYDSQRQSGLLADWSHVLLQSHNWNFLRPRCRRTGLSGVDATAQ